MSSAYTPMWQSLGLDLPAHDKLLSILGQAYGDIYLSQKNRPAGMQYLDFVLSEIHGLRIKELMVLAASANSRPDELLFVSLTFPGTSLSAASLFFSTAPGL